MKFLLIFALFAVIVNSFLVEHQDDSDLNLIDLESEVSNSDESVASRQKRQIGFGGIGLGGIGLGFGGYGGFGFPGYYGGYGGYRGYGGYGYGRGYGGYGGYRRRYWG